jgi:hypothetical protein
VRGSSADLVGTELRLAQESVVVDGQVLRNLVTQRQAVLPASIDRLAVDFHYR